MALITLLQCTYLLLIIPLFVYAMGTFYLILLYLRRSNGASKPPVLPDWDWPKVTVQLPLFNERHVACRVIDAAAALDYPPDRLCIQILDDSTDDTTQIIQGWIKRYPTLQIQLIHRQDRTGFKGGALAYGLQHDDSEFVAIFDADFVPAPDFLRRTIPHFYTDERIGVVQGRWGHLNTQDNLLTRSQAMMLDAHFAVEQYARSENDLILSFNGTGGVWRRRCIEDAGDWQPDTLTEDADLSFRAHLRGWRFVFLRDVIVPGELSPLMNGFKQQQARWAKGTTQVLVKLAGRLWASPLPLRKRLMGILQLCAYPMQPFGLALFLLSPLVMATHALDGIPLAPMGIAGLAAPILFLLGQRALYRDGWLERSLVFPVLLLITTGLALSNTEAVFSALRGKAGEFKRTPKFKRENGQRSGQWRKSGYALLADRLTAWELLLGLYAVFGITIAARHSPSMIPYFLVYGAGFFIVALWSIADALLADRGGGRDTPTYRQPSGSASND